MTTFNLICLNDAKKGSKVLAAGHTIEFDEEGVALAVPAEAAEKLLGGKQYAKWDGRSPRQILEEKREADREEKAAAHKQALRRNIDLSMQSGLGSVVKELVDELFRQMGVDPDELRATPEGNAQFMETMNKRRAEVKAGAPLTPAPKRGQIQKQPLPPAPLADEPVNEMVAAPDEVPDASEADTTELPIFVGDSGVEYVAPTEEGGEWPDPVDDMPLTYLKACADAYDMKYSATIKKATLIKKLHTAMYSE